MYVSVIEVSANFHLLCDPLIAYGEGLILWLDFYNYFVNDIRSDDNNDTLFNPMRTNLNYETNQRNLCFDPNHY